MFVREADDAISIGPATFIDQRDGQPKSSYQHRERIEEALLAAQASAVWAGWGIQASESWLADLCERLGITFIGPDAGVLRLLSDGISARQLAQQANIPVVPASDGGIEAAHHLEVQMIADQYGTTWAIDVRKCTHCASRPAGTRRIWLSYAATRRKSASCVRRPFGCASLQATGMLGVWSSCMTPASTPSGSWGSIHA